MENVPSKGAASLPARRPRTSYPDLSTRATIGAQKFRLHAGSAGRPRVEEAPPAPESAPDPLAYRPGARVDRHMPVQEGGRTRFYDVDQGEREPGDEARRFLLLSRPGSGGVVRYEVAECRDYHQCTCPEFRSEQGPAGGDCAHIRALLRDGHIRPVHVFWSVGREGGGA